ncbi:MAG: PAS domain S-box protein [Alphaproteobacteria bacterium]|nr:PAS domain S-box protein [Alphaproteobacteria bacterium]
MKNDVLDFTALFQTMPIPRIIVEVRGEEYIVTNANNMAERYFGVKKDQMIGHDLSQFLDAENTRHFTQSFEVCIKRKKMVTIQALPTIAGDIKVHGFWVNPSMDKDGNVQYIDVLGQPDIRDQSILQRERDDAILLLASIFEVSEIGIIVTDENGKVSRVNDSFVRTYGWRREQIINNDFTMLVAEDERDKTRINQKKSISVGVRSTGEIKILRSDGTVANALFTSATLKLSQNRKFLITTVMDITLRKKMEQTLRFAKEQADSANRSKSSFLANMSHELRTPLNAIIGFSELMIKETFGPVGQEKYKEYLNDVHMSAEHLLGIINEVLDMSKIESGHLELSENKVNVAELIDSVVRMMASRVFASNIEIETKIDDKLPYLWADHRLLRQVLINIITNAVKFSKENGLITIQATIDNSRRMVIIISDQGIGIEKEKIHLALEPFGQVSDKPERREIQAQGTGLGLPLAKAMVELHGGRLTLESEYGKGTVVTTLFPADRTLLENEACSAE